MEMMVEQEPAEADEERRTGRALGRPWLVALVVWVVATPVAALVPSVFHLDPFFQQSGVVPLAIGGAVLLAAGCVGWRWRGDAMVGAAAGLFAAFVVLVLRSSLQGTPFAFQGVTGDSGRLSAMVTRYSVSWGTSDGIVAGVPAEYPPLFPWVLGHLAALSGTAPWRMLQTRRDHRRLGLGRGRLRAVAAVVPATSALAISVLGLTVLRRGRQGLRGDRAGRRGAVDTGHLRGPGRAQAALAYGRCDRWPAGPHLPCLPAVLADRGGRHRVLRPEGRGVPALCRAGRRGDGGAVVVVPDPLRLVHAERWPTRRRHVPGLRGPREPVPVPRGEPAGLRAARRGGRPALLPAVDVVVARPAGDPAQCLPLPGDRPAPLCHVRGTPRCTTTRPR